MSAKPILKHCLMAGLLSTTMAVGNNARARDWSDVISTPLVDPLLSRPPQLDRTTVLPGDAQAAGCMGDINDHLDRQQALTLSAAVDLGLCHHPQVQSAWASIKLQAAQVGAARAAYLPTVNMGMSRSRQKNSSSESRFSINSDRITDSRYLTLTWRLLDFGTRDANRRAANAALEAALASHDAVLQKTLAQIIGAYFDAQSAKADRDAKEKSEALARYTWDTAKKREARGAGAQTDTLQARTAHAKAELERSRAIGRYRKSLSELVVTLGLPVPMSATQELLLAPDYMDMENTLRHDLASWLALAQERHPALLTARAQLTSIKEKLTAARAEGLPTLDFTGSQYVNGRPNQSASSVNSKESVIGLAINIPLFDGFANTYKVRGAQAQIEKKNAEVRETENQILSEIVKAHADAVAALHNLDASKKLIEAAQEALHIVRRKYDRGIVDILDMLNVQMALADAERERLRSLSEWRSARLRLLANAGMVGRKDVQARQ